jgi:hypothetical protein
MTRVTDIFIGGAVLLCVFGIATLIMGLAFLFLVPVIIYDTVFGSDNVS